METKIIGRTSPDTLDREPIIVPIAGYTLDGEEVIERFKFRPTMPSGAAIRAAKAASGTGDLSTGPVVEFLEKSLLAEDRDRFLDFLDRDDLAIQASVLEDVYEAVMEVWAGRPTRSQRNSSRGGAPTRRTSTGAAR